MRNIAFMLPIFSKELEVTELGGVQQAPEGANALNTPLDPVANTAID
jgi:hypothetical protein